MSSHSPCLRVTDLPMPLDVRDLGRMNYSEALAVQRASHAEVVQARDESGGDGHMVLLLVEHDPPVITISRRPGARKHLIATDAQLRTSGVEVCETDRGGDITYHGPGQLVVYPILDLNRLGLRLASYMRFLEQIVIDVLAGFGVEGARDDGATGVWVPPCGRGQSNCEGVTGAKKICALGVRVSKWVSMHGLALNVTTNLDHFNMIVPCGLAGRSVTSMQRELGERRPDMNDVKRAMVEQFKNALNQTRACSPK
jgi:lipoyl(octanoyl) transferase